MALDNALVNRFVKVAAVGVGAVATVGAGYLAWKTGADMDSVNLSLEKICGMRKWPEPGNPTGTFITQTSMALASTRIAMGLSIKFIERARDAANKYFPAKIDLWDIEIRKALYSLRKSDAMIFVLGAGTAIGMPLVAYGAMKAGFPGKDALSTIAGTGFSMVAAGATWLGLTMTSMGLSVAGDADSHKENRDLLRDLNREGAVLKYERECAKASPAPQIG